MNRNELERAWPAAEPPPGFSDRVLERLQREVAPPEPTPRAGLTSWRIGWRRSGWRQKVRWLALPAAALLLGGALLLWPAGAQREGDVIAAEPRVVAIGERAMAELASGAHVHWSGNRFGGDEVQQDRGTVTYRVQPGAEFRVQTPHGSVRVLGTVFQVIVADDGPLTGDSMKQKWAVAGAGATLGGLLWVGVEQGSVRLSNGKEELTLHAGQAGAVGADSIPRLQLAAPTPPSSPGNAPSTASDQHASDERARARQVADAVRRHAARLRAATAAATPARTSASRTSASPTPSSQPPSEPPAPEDRVQLSAEEGERRQQYMRRVLTEQYIPVARTCYEELLGRDPKAGGRVVLEFAVVSDGDAGVVDRVALREGETTIDDPELTQCMRESLYTAVFEPPPPGARETTVVYPLELRPDGEDTQEKTQ